MAIIFSRIFSVHTGYLICFHIFKNVVTIHLARISRSILDNSRHFTMSRISDHAVSTNVSAQLIRVWTFQWRQGSLAPPTFTFTSCYLATFDTSVYHFLKGLDVRVCCFADILWPLLIFSWEHEILCFSSFGRGAYITSCKFPDPLLIEQRILLILNSIQTSGTSLCDSHITWIL